MNLDLAATAVSVTFFLAVLVIALAIERLAPAEKQPLSAGVFNIGYTVVYLFAQAAIIPVVSGATVLAINSLGGGFFKLSSTGWEFVASVAIYTVSIDLMEYLFHRAQHRFPALWAMHSLHHSDQCLNASTTDRHFWAEHAIKTVTIYLLIGLIFQAPPEVLGAYTLLSLYNVVLHMNIRVGIGRASYLINTPQFHRIHHSVLPRHYDCNFAALFPIYDVIFGTYRQPAPGEFPPTGIDTGEQPTGLIGALIWPLRKPKKDPA